MATEYLLDGTKITSLEDFYNEVGRSLAIGDNWGRNLDALDDVLSGGDHGIPEDGFTIEWTSSEISRANLGYVETVRQLEKRLLHCHPTNRETVGAELDNARQFAGDTVFDWLIDIIRSHENKVRLVLA